MRSKVDQLISGAGGVLAAICHLVSLAKMELGEIALVGMQSAGALFATFCCIGALPLRLRTINHENYEYLRGSISYIVAVVSPIAFGCAYGIQLYFDVSPSLGLIAFWFLPIAIWFQAVSLGDEENRREVFSLTALLTLSLLCYVFFIDHISVTDRQVLILMPYLGAVCYYFHRRYSDLRMIFSRHRACAGSNMRFGVAEIMNAHKLGVNSWVGKGAPLAERSLALMHSEALVALLVVFAQLYALVMKLLLPVFLILEDGIMRSRSDENTPRIVVPIVASFTLGLASLMLLSIVTIQGKSFDIFGPIPYSLKIIFVAGFLFSLYRATLKKIEYALLRYTNRLARDRI